VAVHWVEQGIDGWRLDVPGEIRDNEFWREFRRRVKGANPDVYIVGEIWHDARHWLQGDQFDAVMNYLFTKACLSFFVGQALDAGLTSGVGYYPIQPVMAEGFARAIDELLAMYAPQVTQAQLNLLDSHDTARLLTLAQGDESALRLAWLFMMCYPGAPCVYYGDEIGMAGGKDPDCRRAFPWDERKWNLGLRDYLRRCIALRKAHPALRRGEFRPLYAQGEVYAFARQLDKETLIAVLNVGQTPWTLDVPLNGLLSDGAVLEAVWGEGMASVAHGQLVGPAVPARGGVVLEVRRTGG